MKNIVILALLVKISAIELKQLQKTDFWPTEYETLYASDTDPDSPYRTFSLA